MMMCVYDAVGMKAVTGWWRVRLRLLVCRLLSLLTPTMNCHLELKVYCYTSVCH